MRYRSSTILGTVLLATIIISLFVLPGRAHAAIALHAAPAQPCLSIGDLDFGTLNPGQSSSKDLMLCNQGDGQITFREPFLTWIRSEYSVSQADIDKLKNMTLEHNDCVTITVTFKSFVTGAFRDAGHIFVNAGGSADGCRDVSTWTALVTKPGPFITGHDWEKRWLSSDNQCTKNGIHDYTWDVTATNTGTKDFIVRELKLVGKDADDGIFYLDPGDGQTVRINPGDKIRASDPTSFGTQRVHFKPVAERDYSCTIMLITEDGDTAQNSLLGIGVESDVAIEDHDFGAVQFGGPEPSAITQMVTIGPGRSTRGTTLTGVSLAKGTDFSLTGNFFKSDGVTRITLPYTMALHEAINAETQFHPRAAAPAQKFDTLIIAGDFRRCADSTGALVGAVVSNAGVLESQTDAATMNCTIEPNPFAAATTVAFTLEASGRTSVEIFDAAGTRVASLADEILDAGNHVFRWDAVDLLSGFYYCRIHAGARSIMRPVLLVR